MVSTYGPHVRHSGRDIDICPTEGMEGLFIAPFKETGKSESFHGSLSIPRALSCAEPCLPPCFDEAQRHQLHPDQPLKWRAGGESRRSEEWHLDISCPSWTPKFPLFILAEKDLATAETEAVPSRSAKNCQGKRQRPTPGRKGRCKQGEASWAPLSPPCRSPCSSGWSPQLVAPGGDFSGADYLPECPDLWYPLPS